MRKCIQKKEGEIIAGGNNLNRALVINTYGL